MEFRILGPLEVVIDDGEVALGGPRPQRLLAALLLQPNVAVARDRLVESVWPGDPPASAVAGLQVYVHELRRRLGEERIETQGTAYRVRVEADELDASRFERMLDRARSLPPAAAADALDAALALWRGAPFAGLEPTRELEAAARALAESRLEAIELQNDALLALGRHQAVLAVLEQLIAEHPYRERLRAQQILALYRSGRQADALAAYQRARATWVRDLGIEPSPDLQELERSVLRHEVAPGAPVPADPPHLLPTPVTALVGRGREIEEVTELVRGDARLVTLVGAGGAGKTRLAIAAARELAPELPDGAAFVDLSAVTEPEFLPATIARSLALATPDALEEELRARTMLLVLDNLEQLLPSVDWIGRLLADAPGVRVLATSRAPLRLYGEHRYAVPALDPEESAQLFTARARAVDRTFTAAPEEVAALCRRLDGLPLAIELAAARANVLPPREMLRRLDEGPESLGRGPEDRPERHRTLAATMRWSYDLLEPEERVAFPRLAVFQGGFTATAAERVDGVDVDVLASLVGNSLVEVRGERFVLLETVRRFALAQLDGDAAVELRRRHADWLVELAERTEARLAEGADAGPLLDAIEAEHDNIRAALTWAVEAGASEAALRLATALRAFWEVRGHVAEGGRRLEAALEAGAGASPALRVKALGVAGTIAFRSGDLDRAGAQFDEMLELSEAAGDDAGVARGLSDVATIAAAKGDLDRAGELFRESAVRFRELDEPQRLSIVLANIGHIAGERGDFETAIAVTEEALALQRHGGDQRNQAISLFNLGAFAVDAGDRERAHTGLAECVRFAARLGYREVIAYALTEIARLCIVEGDAERAARMAGAAETLLAEIEVRLQPSAEASFDETRARARESLGAAGYDAAHATGAAMSYENVVAVAGA